MPSENIIINESKKKIMEAILESLATCVEFGKINEKSPYPPAMKGQPGADELTRKALDAGLNPAEILEKGLIPGMNAVGVKFSEKKVFVPEMLMAAKAMSVAMVHLKPYFQSGAVKHKGTVVIGTVFGDLHEIGKNLISMAVEGAGWEVIDLGTDVKTEKFIDTIEQYPDCVVALSALLTTTMQNMESIVKDLKQLYPNTRILVGGAPLSNSFCRKIGADFYGKNPQETLEYLNNLSLTPA